MIRPDEDGEARLDARRAARVALEAIVGTDEGQVAVAPGRLRRTWTGNGRRYWHYATDAPIRNDYAFFSAAYAVHEGRWNDVSIQVFHHPAHAWNADRLVRSVHASLDYYTQQFGPYPHGQVRLVEHPGEGVSLHASPVNISYEEGFSLLNPSGDPRDIDFPFAVVAHEVAHQWWGHALIPAEVEGAALLTESLAWYSALQVVERTFGREHLARLLGMMREAYVRPRARADVPLLRADDWFLAYRKGPFAMYALRETSARGRSTPRCEGSSRGTARPRFLCQPLSISTGSFSGPSRPADGEQRSKRVSRRRLRTAGPAPNCRTYSQPVVTDSPLPGE